MLLLHCRYKGYNANKIPKYHGDLPNVHAHVKTFKRGNFSSKTR